MNANHFHKDFCLNGRNFASAEELLDYTNKNIPIITPFLTEWFSDTKILTVNTSGSTGKPKPINIQKQFMINSALATGSFFNLPKNTNALLCLPTNYIAGKMMLVRSMVLGWNLDVVEASSSPLKNNKSYNFVAMVPMQVQKSILDLHKAKIILIGGGEVSQKLIETFSNIKSKIFQSYGMTETVTHIAVREIHPNFSEFYTTLPQVKITTDNRNCLVINAPKVASGKIVTNDLVQIKNDNQFKWLGRVDNIINSGGIKLIPEQIEGKLQKIITSPFFIHKKQDDLLGEKVVLIVQGEKDKNLIKRIQSISDLNQYEKPKEIHFLDEFIYTKTDKINRVATVKNIF
jgi:O-succinylbenzoic acid--CoA ligase